METFPLVVKIYGHVGLLSSVTLVFLDVTCDILKWLVFLAVTCNIMKWLVFLDVTCDIMKCLVFLDVTCDIMKCLVPFACSTNSSCLWGGVAE